MVVDVAVVHVVVVPDPSPLREEAFRLVLSLSGRESSSRPRELKKSLALCKDAEEGVSAAFCPGPPVPPPTTLWPEMGSPVVEDIVVAETLVETVEDGGTMCDAELVAGT